MKECLIIIALAVSTTILGQEIQQQVIASGGDQSESETVSISWTLGEVAIGTFENESMIITQGFQQGDLRVSNLVEKSLLDFSLKAYPNPVLDILTVEFDRDDLAYQLVDMNGKIILNGKLYTESGTIDLTGLTEGIYFLVVDEKRTHKIIKQ